MAPRKKSEFRNPKSETNPKLEKDRKSGSKPEIGPVVFSAAFRYSNFPLSNLFRIVELSA